MIDNVRSAMARMATIRSTMGVHGAVAPPPRTQTPTTQAAIQTMFSQALTQASSTAPTAFGTGQGFAPVQARALTPVAGTVRKGPPPGFEQYQNGRIPPEALAPIGEKGERMWAPAAAAFDHMRRDAAAAGVSLPVVDAYRPLEDQVRLADQLGLYKEGGLAAVPGTSQHGWGRAIDLELDDRGLAWMRDNAWKYGYVETVPREPWHWEFHPAA